MATRNLQPHEVVPARLGVNAKGGQARVYAVTTDAVQILWKSDSLQYVPSRGQTSSGSGTVVEVPGVLVYRVERFTTGLYGTFAEPLSALSPGTLNNTKGTSGFNPSRGEGQSIMDMDTNEITIDRIVCFPWNDPGTDVEDELPTPASSPVQCTTPAAMPVEPGDPQELGDNLDLAKVLLDVSSCRR